MGGILLNNLVIRLFWKNYTDDVKTKESEKESVNDETDSPPDERKEGVANVCYIL
jgi:hypothetical protein